MIVLGSVYMRREVKSARSEISNRSETPRVFTSPEVKSVRSETYFGCGRRKTARNSDILYSSPSSSLEQMVSRSAHGFGCVNIEFI